MVTVPHIVVGLERMLDYRGVGLAKFHCISSGTKYCEPKNPLVKIASHLCMFMQTLLSRNTTRRVPYLVVT